MNYKILKTIIITSIIILPTFIFSEENSLEFVFTQEETLAMSKWNKNNLPLDDVIEEAFLCNSAALCLLGHLNLYGLSGFTIDVSEAEMFFALSASFGFAPGIDEIAIAQIRKNNNVCLALIYKNLAISFGHPEMVITYHKCREIIAKEFGNHICEEIEKVAARKKEIIIANMKKLSESKDKEKLLLQTFASENLITKEDSNLGLDFWDKLLKSKLKQAE